MGVMGGADLPAELERREPEIRRRAGELLDAVRETERRGPSWADFVDGLLDRAFADRAFRNGLLRFVELYPATGSVGDVVDHLGVHLFADRFPLLSALLTASARFGAGGPAALVVHIAVRAVGGRFIGGETPADAVRLGRSIAREGGGATWDILGEAALSEAEADRHLGEILGLVRALRDSGAEVDVSVKASALTSFLDPVDPDESGRRLRPRLRAVLREVGAAGGFVWLDGEDREVIDLATGIFLGVCEESGEACRAGVVVQAYLRDAEARARRLMDWSDRVGRTLRVRLVKGAYWDAEVVRARQRGWEPPVWPTKAETDACFERLLVLLTRHPRIVVAAATHNVRSIAAAAAAFDALPPERRGEFQILHGMAHATREALVGAGRRVRVYVPLGPLVPGTAYLVRRLLENTSNESFLRRERLAGRDREDLLRSPHAAVRDAAVPVPPADRPPAAEPPFRNAPAPAFFRPEERRRLADAVAARLTAPPDEVRPVVGGREVRTGADLRSENPSHPARLVARGAAADAALAAEAIAVARRGEAWSRRRFCGRAAILDRAAEILLADRDEIAALEVCEAAKPWADAVADVNEAVDFIRYYAAEARRLDDGLVLQPGIPGERNLYRYRPRGVAAVISPWNFPLAIPAGQTAAALAAGDRVLFKPAEATPAVGRRLVDAYLRAGVDPDAIAFLPGAGETVGAALVEGDVDVVAFTGSRAVGEAILGRAARRPGPSGAKRVVAEMGGKNAVIVDADADLELAVGECLHAAFNYAGQKCSALSRLILLEPVYEAFLERFVEAARDFPLGPAEIAASRLTPLISDEARRRVGAFMETAGREGRWRLAPSATSLPAEGYFAPPTVVELDDPRARTAQEEVFGPLVAVLRARDLDEALSIANGTAYALTGGLFSRHPAHVAYVVERFDVGNLYINRGITGAVVGRHPFGGHRASGVGSKAGGPDYLAQFLLPVTVSENLARHGFSPDVGG